jgi:death-on-curing protein
METFLVLNGWDVQASIDEQERLMLSLASGEMTRDQLATWLRDHMHARR